MYINDEIWALILKLDSSDTNRQEMLWDEIKKQEIDIPFYFNKAYDYFKKWQGRVFLVFHCIKYARQNEYAFQLGVKGLSDKATLVRYRATCILAYSLRSDAIPHLKNNLNHIDKETAKDCERAIRAINNKNHHIFMEGRGIWIVNPEDEKNKDASKPLGFFSKLFK